jgi:arylsulfatase
LKTPGSINHEQVSVFDIMPTAMKLAEAEYPSEFEGRTLKPMRGIDLSPSFDDQPLPKNRPLFFFWDKTTAFIHGEWKIVSTSGRNFDPKKYELYNLENDRTEMNDLSGSNPEKLHDMVDAAREYVAGLRAEF